jgi:hypothetical protein
MFTIPQRKADGIDMRGLMSKRRARRMLAILVVFTVTTVVVIGIASYNFGSREAFAFNISYPAPTTYIPGSSPPNLYLQINYTGPGVGSFYYVVTYNSSSGSVVAGQGAVLVSPLSPYTAYFIIGVPTNTIVVANAQVFSNSASSHSLLFTKSVSL